MPFPIFWKTNRFELVFSGNVLQVNHVGFEVWAFACLLGERKVRTPQGRIPRESEGTPRKLVVTDSVTENNRPVLAQGKGAKGR